MARLTGMIVGVAFMAAGSLIALSPAGSHSGAKGVVKDRMEMMKSLATATARMAKILRARGKLSPQNRQAFADSAALIERHATGMLKLFPKGSGTHPSEALPKVWSDWKGFEAAARQMAGAAAKLKAAAPSTDRKSLMIDFVGVARSCSACHAQYRLKKR